MGEMALFQLLSGVPKVVLTLIYDDTIIMYYVHVCTIQLRDRFCPFICLMILNVCIPALPSIPIYYLLESPPFFADIS